MFVPLHPNRRWSVDFLSDGVGVCHGNMALTADTSISGPRVARKLAALVSVHGKPACTDNGTEFTGRAILT
jgi:putative transposase